jgi:hypothetical protein
MKRKTGFQIAYENGFKRAIGLTLGTGLAWTRADKLLRNHVTRQLFGRKRAKR